MEHRYFRRHPDHFDVILSNPRYGTADAQVVDISREGMALRLNGSPFPKGTLLDVVLPESKETLYHSRYLKGYVVYVERDRIGLWLLEPAAELDAHLQGSATHAS